MPASPDTSPSGPLILGASGRIGAMWRRLAQEGQWPGAVPLWHSRTGRGDYLWDMDATPAADPRLAGVRGMIVLAGTTSGDAANLARNTHCARAALDLAAREGIGPVLLCSSSAVYARPAPDAAPLTEAAATVAPDDPRARYGAAKHAMERDAADHRTPSACLRIANVAGADAALLAAARGNVTLHRLADGTAPRRHYIGPLGLAQVCTGLIAAHHGGAALPRVLNVACPDEIAMSALLDAANVPFEWTPAPEDALPALPLDLSCLLALAPVPAAVPSALVAEARAAGWVPA